MARQPYDYQPILNFITTYTADNGYPPTLREIGKACHLTKTAVWYHLNRLCDMGIITKQPKRIRGINVNPGAIENYSSDSLEWW